MYTGAYKDMEKILRNEKKKTTYKKTNISAGEGNGSSEKICKVYDGIYTWKFD